MVVNAVVYGDSYLLQQGTASHRKIKQVFVYSVTKLLLAYDPYILFTIILFFILAVYPISLPQHAILTIFYPKLILTRSKVMIGNGETLYTRFIRVLFFIYYSKKTYPITTMTTTCSKQFKNINITLSFQSV